MPTARESLLRAAHAALRTRPWTAVRMVDVAASAGVSRQTLYNEFGSKEGLGAALVGRLVDDFLDGAAHAVSEAVGRGADPAGCCAAAARWMLRTAREEPVVRAALTGCWGARTPLPAARPVRSPGAAGQPALLAALLRDRAVSGLEAAGPPPGAPPPAGGGLPGEAERPGLEFAYEVGLRLALSYVVAPPGAVRDGADGPEGPEGPDGGTGAGDADGAAVADGAFRGDGADGAAATEGADVPDGEPCGRVDETVRALLGRR